MKLTPPLLNYREKRKEAKSTFRKIICFSFLTPFATSFNKNHMKQKYTAYTKRSHAAKGKKVLAKAFVLASFSKIVLNASFFSRKATKY
jgi:hypothetical protein